MVGIKKTEQDKQQIKGFVKAMKQALVDNIDHVEKQANMTAQQWFEIIMENIYNPKGSLYLCFQCGEIMSRHKVKTQKFFQVKQVYHDCLGNLSGAVYPTPGVICYWEDVINYLKEKNLYL